jgi:hypothetical protein
MDCRSAVLTNAVRAAHGLTIPDKPLAIADAETAPRPRGPMAS